MTIFRECYLFAIRGNPYRKSWVRLLGEGARKIMRVFSVILLVLVGVVFMMGPAGLLANLSFTRFY